MSKPAPLTSLNVRRKGEAQPTPDALARGEVPPAVAAVQTPARVPSAELVSLSLKVPPAFKKRYQQAALDAGMKLNTFLFHLLDQHETRSRNS